MPQQPVDYDALAKQYGAVSSVAPTQGSPRPYETALNPQEEQLFQTWKTRYAPHDTGDDYDLRGAFKAGLTPDPQTGHWPDTFKKPNHPTFSVESKYAKEHPEGAGSWNGNTYVPAPKQQAIDYDALATKYGASAPSRPQERPVQGVPTGKITNSPGGVGGYLEQLEGDIRYGGDSTMIGKALKTLGAQGLNRSVSEGAVERGPVSPLLGSLKALRGAVSIPQHPLRGAGQMLSGAAQALEIPLSFVGASPGAVDAALVRTVPPVAKEAAGQAFQELDQAVGHVPVSHDAAISVANRIDELSKSGGSMPKVVHDFINRVTDPMRGQMTYSEARDFYSNATRLSSEEASRLTPVMGRQMGKFTQALGDSIQKAADSVGMGEQYANAMKNYSFGAKGEKFIGGLAEALKWLAVAKVAGSTAGSVAKKVTK